MSGRFAFPHARSSFSQPCRPSRCRSARKAIRSGRPRFATWRRRAPAWCLKQRASADEAEEYCRHVTLGLAVWCGAVRSAPPRSRSRHRSHRDALTRPSMPSSLAGSSGARRGAPACAGPDGLAAFRFSSRALVQSHCDLPSAGRRPLLATHQPGVTSELASRMEAAGVMLGQTNLPGSGSWRQRSQLFGRQRNPWDLTRSTGGNRGSAAAVASAWCPLAHSGDGGSSLRIPASCWPVRPQAQPRPQSAGTAAYHGLWPVAGGARLTRSVRDSAAVLDATSASRSRNAAQRRHREAGAFLAAQPAAAALRCAVLDAPLFNDAIDPACRAGVRRQPALGDLGHVVGPSRTAGRH